MHELFKFKSVQILYRLQWYLGFWTVAYTKFTSAHYRWDSTSQNTSIFTESGALCCNVSLLSQRLRDNANQLQCKNLR